MFGGKTLAPALRVSPMEQAEAASSEAYQHDNRGTEPSMRPFISAHLNNQDGLPVSPPQGSREESPVRALPPSPAHVPPFTEGGDEVRTRGPTDTMVKSSDSLSNRCLGVITET